MLNSLVIALVKPEQIRIRVPTDDVSTLDELAGSILSRTDVATMLLHAAIEAVRQNPTALKFPPAFVISIPPANPKLNDKSKPKK